MIHEENLYDYVMARGGNWIQDVTESIKQRNTEGRCTGSNFGGPSCPPGSPQYNLAKTFRKMAKSHKLGGSSNALQNTDIDDIRNQRINTLRNFLSTNTINAMMEDEFINAGLHTMMQGGGGTLGNVNPSMEAFGYNSDNVAHLQSYIDKMNTENQKFNQAFTDLLGAWDETGQYKKVKTKVKVNPMYKDMYSKEDITELYPTQQFVDSFYPAMQRGGTNYFSRTPYEYLNQAPGNVLNWSGYENPEYMANRFANRYGALRYMYRKRTPSKTINQTKYDNSTHQVSQLSNPQKAIPYVHPKQTPSKTINQTRYNNSKPKVNQPSYLQRVIQNNNEDVNNTDYSVRTPDEDLISVPPIVAKYIDNPYYSINQPSQRATQNNNRDVASVIDDALSYRNQTNNQTATDTSNKSSTSNKSLFNKNQINNEDVTGTQEGTSTNENQQDNNVEKDTGMEGNVDISQYQNQNQNRNNNNGFGNLPYTLRAQVNYRRALLPGNRLKNVIFSYGLPPQSNQEGNEQMQDVQSPSERFNAYLNTLRYNNPILYNTLIDRMNNSEEQQNIKEPGYDYEKMTAEEDPNIIPENIALYGGPMMYDDGGEELDPVRWNARWGENEYGRSKTSIGRDWGLTAVGMLKPAIGMATAIGEKVTGPDRAKQVEQMSTADRVFSVVGGDRGYDTVNPVGVSSPDQNTPVQFTGMAMPVYNRYGGPMTRFNQMTNLKQNRQRNFQVGGTYQMTDEEIQEFLMAGGQIEFID